MALGLLGVLLGVAGCPNNDPNVTEDTTTDAETTTATTTTGESEIPVLCVRWLACSATIDPDNADEMASKYGEGGSCWSADDGVQAGCVAFCDNQLRSYGQSFPELDECRFDDIVGTAEFVIGEAVFDPDDPFALPVYRHLNPGDSIQIVRGGQGLLMLPIAIRGTGFVVADDPLDWDNPKTPRIHLWVDIPGFNVGFGGYFARIPNYPIGFVEVDNDGTLEHLYIAILVPDAIAEPQMLTNQPGVIRAELATYMQPTKAIEWPFVVASEIQGE